MDTRRLLSACALVALSVTEGASTGVVPQPQPAWHTRPDRWSEPRHFQTPFEERFQQRILIQHTSQSPDPKVKVYSPNKAYWFGIDPDLNPEPLSERRVRFGIDAADARIRIFNERDPQVVIVLKDHYPYFEIIAGWVSEKLLFIRVWWGRVLGTDMVFDVEKESFVYREMVNDGSLPFQQFQQYRRNRGPD